MAPNRLPGLPYGLYYGAASSPIKSNNYPIRESVGSVACARYRPQRPLHVGGQYRFAALTDGSREGESQPKNPGPPARGDRPKKTRTRIANMFTGK